MKMFFKIFRDKFIEWLIEELSEMLTVAERNLLTKIKNKLEKNK